LTAGQSYSILVQSTDPQTNSSIQQVFQISAGGTDPVTPTVALSNSTIAGSLTGSGIAAEVGALSTTGPAVGEQVNYSLVSGAGDDNNSSFQIGTVSVNGQTTMELETVGSLTPGTYSIRVRSTSTFLISSVDDLNGISGPTAFEVSLDPSKLPSGFPQAAAAAGLITLSSDPTGGWYPAVTTNAEKPGSLAQTNYQGPYSSFWASVTAANPSATLNDVVGSSGVDLATDEAWAVVDRSGEYAVGTQVYTEQVFTITVT
jgi:hypothetical protein